MNNSMTILHSGKQYRMTKSYGVVDGEIITLTVKLRVENIDELYAVVEFYFLWAELQ
jgi:hypothetical protein